MSLVENLVFGPTIAQAAAGRTANRMNEAATLTALSELVFSALTAQLPEAARTGIDQIAKRAAQTSDCEELLSALAPMADALRYGKARATDTGQMENLFERIALQGALALPYAARNLDAEAAERLRRTIRDADRATRLLTMEDGFRGLDGGANHAGLRRSGHPDRGRPGRAPSL